MSEKEPAAQNGEAAMHLPIQCDREYRMLLGIETIYLQHPKMGGEHVLMGLLFAWNRYSTCQTPSLSLSPFRQPRRDQGWV